MTLRIRRCRRSRREAASVAAECLLVGASAVAVSVHTSPPFEIAHLDECEREVMTNKTMESTAAAPRCLSIWSGLVDVVDQDVGGGPPPRLLGPMRMSICPKL